MVLALSRRDHSSNLLAIDGGAGQWQVPRVPTPDGSNSLRSRCVDVSNEFSSLQLGYSPLLSRGVRGRVITEVCARGLSSLARNDFESGARDF